MYTQLSTNLRPGMASTIHPHPSFMLRAKLASGLVTFESPDLPRRHARIPDFRIPHTSPFRTLHPPTHPTTSAHKLDDQSRTCPAAQTLTDAQIESTHAKKSNTVRVFRLFCCDLSGNRPNIGSTSNPK